MAKNKMQNIGTRRQVWNGTAKRTSGGLTKSDLVMSHGHIVSKSKHISAKKEMRLLKYGYGTEKGKFGYVKIDTKGRKGRKSRSRKMRGGSSPLNPSELAGGDSVTGNPIDGYNQMGSNLNTSYMLNGGSAFLGGKHKGSRKHRMRGGIIPS